MHVLFLLAALLFLPCHPAPSSLDHSVRLALRAADVAWAKAVRLPHNASTLVPAAHAAYLAAHALSHSTCTEAFWEAARVATVGCLHHQLPARAALQAALDAELSATTSAASPHGTSLVSHMVALAHLDGPRLLRLARAWASAFDPGGPAPPPALARPAWPTLRRPRLLLLSAHLGDHPVGHHITALLQHLNRSAWEVLCVASAPPDGSATLALNEAACGGAGSLLPLPSGALPAAHALAALAPDVLLALDGYEAGHRADALAALARLRLPTPPPLVVGFFGFLGTLGAPYVQAVLGDAVALPPSAAPLYAERALLRHASTFFVSNHAALHPEVLGAPPYAAGGGSGSGSGSPQQPFAFCAVSQLWKASAAQVAAWLDVLAAAPGAELLLLEHPPIARAGLQAAHSQHPAWPRVRWLQLLPRQQHLLAKRAACGLGLDTEGYNGHASTADLLWAGVPVLTLVRAGSALAGRAAASLLAAAGAPPAFVTHSVQEQAQRALQVWRAYSRRGRQGEGEGEGEGALGAVGADGGQLAAEAEAPPDAELLWRPLPSAQLFDSQGWTRGLEAALRSAFEGGSAEWREGH